MSYWLPVSSTGSTGVFFTTSTTWEAPAYSYNALKSLFPQAISYSLWNIMAETMATKDVWVLILKPMKV